MTHQLIHLQRQKNVWRGDQGLGRQAGDVGIEAGVERKTAASEQSQMSTVKGAGSQ